MTRLDFFCSPAEVKRERQGYWRAFRKLDSVSCRQVTAIPHTNIQLDEQTPILLYPDPPESAIPEQLPQMDSISACFQIDAFAKPDWRALWSCLFDYVFVFHPELEGFFSAYQHPRVIILPHAVDAAGFSDREMARLFEVGWVGTTRGTINSSRRRLLPRLAQQFKMNDWQNHYPEEHVTSIYRQSVVVVNISRDDHPQDANLRCFEAMAAGSLLITRLPTELLSIGFEEGRHFIGYHDEEELPRLIAAYLDDEPARRRIVDVARSKVLSEHTYDVRAKKILEVIHSDAGRHFAPAREWSQPKQDYAFFHYYCKRVMWARALSRFRKLCRHAPHMAIRGIPILLRCAWHHQRQSLQSLGG